MINFIFISLIINERIFIQLKLRIFSVTVFGSTLPTVTVFGATLPNVTQRYIVIKGDFEQIFSFIKKNLTLVTVTFGHGQ